MSRDLEEQLDELGPAYRAVVARLRAAREAEIGGSRGSGRTIDDRQPTNRESQGLGRPTTDNRQTGGSRRQTTNGVRRRWLSFVGRRLSYLVAASLAVVLGFVFFRSSKIGQPDSSAPLYTVRVTDAERAYALAVLRDDKAVQELIRTQNPDGSWKTDELTRRNAELLKTCRSEAAQAAYRKAMDNLRARGLL